MDKKTVEWLKQADYDMDTAEFMANGGKHFYAVFMCHLAMEKALKGLYLHNLQEAPPKTHSLVFLLNKIGLRPDPDKGRVVAILNEANIATRYPDDIDKLQSKYTQEIASRILAQTKEILEWIKAQF
ncbi:MAG: HEPN domain-containing protein [Phycisphaerae bacterium]|nr:HEPN domain-containing protein [Phycisphaerae bacterium]